MRGVPDSLAALTYFQSLPAIAYTSNTLQHPSTPQSQGQDGYALGQPLNVFVCVGKADPVLGEAVMSALAKSAWGGSCGYWWHVIEDGGHFVQEWAAHVPSLADQAWSNKSPSNTVVHDRWRADWVEPKPKSLL
ncbi:hypothetical protein CBS101457_003902 [Exobasidium rhododendri]|nr:hypothetical protein CBS101457_003902 [Exobasidium rhododendri]